MTPLNKDFRPQPEVDTPRQYKILPRRFYGTGEGGPSCEFLDYTPSTQVLDWTTEPDWGGDYHSNVSLEDFQAIDPLSVGTLDIFENTNLITEISCLGPYTNLGTIEIYNQRVQSLTLPSLPVLQLLTFIQFPPDPDSGVRLDLLDLGPNPSITEVRCYNNGLLSLILTGATGLTRILGMRNRLTTLDLSQNTALNDVSLDNNQLTSLDISNNPLLTYLSLFNNLLDDAAIDDVLVNLVTAGLSNGAVYLDGAGMGTPTAIGLAAKATLITRGWTVDNN